MDLSVVPARFRPPAVVQVAKTCSMIARMCSRWSLGLMADEEFIQYLAAAGEGLMDVATNLTVGRQYWINQRQEVEASVITPENVQAMTSEAEQWLGQFASPQEVQEASEDPHTEDDPNETE